jgi:hypothetical protein
VDRISQRAKCEEAFGWEKGKEMEEEEEEENKKLRFLYYSNISSDAQTRDYFVNILLPLGPPRKITFEICCYI